jgi:CubicO group peptidase (beta-lactamase class C family)
LLVVAAVTGSALEQDALPNAGEIRRYYEGGLERNGIVGSSVALIRDGKVVFRDNFGAQSLSPAQAVDEKTTYHWASITKTLTGIAIMQLRDRGLLSLDDPLIKYIPELAAVHDAYGPIAQVTIRNVMSHSGGFRDPTWPWRADSGGGMSPEWEPFEPTEWSQLVAMMPYTSVGFAAGSRFSYSNLGVVFEGEIIERLSGDSYESYMEKNVLRPLGMDGSYFDRSPYYLLPYRSHSWDLVGGKVTEDPFDFNTGITRSNGGLNAPLSDMVKYLGFLIGDAGRAEYDVVLKRASLEEMWKPLLAVTPDDDFASRAGAKDEVATSFFVHTDGKLRLIGHAGWQNGFRSHFYIDPATRSGYVVAYNTDAQDGARNTRSFDFALRDYLIDHFFAGR